MYVHGFPPIVDSASRVLILGSMPGKASLRANQYYAHPQNLFWKLVGEHFSIDPTAEYEMRVAALLREGIALWDVLKSCTRESSLDSDIDDSSVVVNDLVGLLERHERIETICFNGVKAATTFERHVAPILGPLSRLRFHRLPSTSPANASIPYPKKLEAWKVIGKQA